jgi:hypothetical protein
MVQRRCVHRYGLPGQKAGQDGRCLAHAQERHRFSGRYTLPGPAEGGALATRISAAARATSLAAMRVTSVGSSSGWRFSCISAMSNSGRDRDVAHRTVGPGQVKLAVNLVHLQPATCYLCSP